MKTGGLHMIKKLGISLVGMAMLLTIGLALIYTGTLRFNYPSTEEFPVRGIDISHHQGSIDWDKLKDNNISFVFIKASEGGDFKDPNFKENWTNARNSGLTVGAYHFYRLCKTGAEQAKNFISLVPRENGTMPPIVDLEFGGNCKTDMSKNEIILEIQIFVKLLEEHYGQTPIIYSTNEFYESHVRNRFMNCPIWIRSIYGRPVLPDNRNWTFWQFANKGHISGIKGHVDINVFNGNKFEFEKLKRGS